MPIQFYRIGQTGEPCRVQNNTTSYSAKIVHGQNLFVLFNKFSIETDAALGVLLWVSSRRKSRRRRNSKLKSRRSSGRRRSSRRKRNSRRRRSSRRKAQVKLYIKSLYKPIKVSNFKYFYFRMHSINKVFTATECFFYNLPIREIQKELQNFSLCSDKSVKEFFGKFYLF